MEHEENEDAAGQVYTNSSDLVVSYCYPTLFSETILSDHTKPRLINASLPVSHCKYHQDVEGFF